MSGLPRLLSLWADLLYPPRCMVCGAFLPLSGRRAAPEKEPEPGFGPLLAGFFCAECAGGCLPVPSPVCGRCGVPLGPECGTTCVSCQEAEPEFGRARAAGAYAGALRDAIHVFKYRGRMELARPLGALLVHAFRSGFEPGSVDLAVPVPLHGSRLRDRGFNQSLLLLRGWGKTGGNQPPLPPVAPRVLARARRTSPQAGLGKAGRAENIRGAFAVRQPDKVRGRRVLLVDDVLTTGATANECARVLKQCGAAGVDVLTVAVVA